MAKNREIRVKIIGDDQLSDDAAFKGINTEAIQGQRSQENSHAGRSLTISKPCARNLLPHSACQKTSNDAAASRLQRLAMRGAMRKTSAIGRGGLGGVGLLGLAYASFRVAGGVRQMADAWTNANNRIKLFTDSAAEQLKIQRELFAIAQKTRIEYGVTSQLYQRLTIANDRLNLTQAETAQLTETINKAFTVSGASAEEARNAIRQLTQAFNKGKLDGDEYRSVAENAGNVLGIIAKQAGVAKGELQQMAEDGKITAKLLADSFLEGADQIDAQFKRMDVSIESSFGVLTNSLTRAVGQFDKATGASDALGRSIRFIGESIDRVDWARVGGQGRGSLTQSQIAAYDPRSRRAGGRGFDEPGGFGSSSGAFVGPMHEPRRGCSPRQDAGK